MAIGYYRLRRNSKKQFYLSGPIQGISINPTDRVGFMEMEIKRTRLKNKYRTKIYTERIPEMEYNHFKSPIFNINLFGKVKSSPIPLLNFPTYLTHSEVYDILNKQKADRIEFLKQKYSKK